MASYKPRGITIAAILTNVVARSCNHEITVTDLRTPVVAAESVQRMVGQ